MKKVLFTVFTVVGFSAISVANNHVEVETLQTEEMFILGDPCVNDQIAAYDECMSNGCSSSESEWFSYGAWGSCMSGKGI
ncbi:hypothetical protein ACHRV1_22090 [Flavobacterium aquidurense]|uniref:hypothetical protein n=1 Tax=Flavobacterium aquidurense TaxID=362413 RepID=UPI003756C95B